MRYLKLILTILIIAAGVLLFKYLMIHKVKTTKKSVNILPPLVKVIKIEKCSQRIEITGTGNVLPLHRSVVQSQVRGKVIFVSNNFLNGKIVRKGEILVKIEETDYLTALKNAEANLEKAKLNYEIIKNKAENSIKEWNRSKNRFKLRKPSKLRFFEPQLKSAKSDIEAAKAQKELARKNLERTIIKSPFKGIVQHKNIDVGDVVTVGRAMGEIVAIDNVEVVTPIPDYDYPFMDFYNKKVKIVLKLKDDIYYFNGKIDRSEKIVSLNTRMINIYSLVEHPYKNLGKKMPLLIGSFVEVKFKGKKFNDIAKIPVTALHNENEIWLAINNKLIRKNVKIIRTDSDYAYIEGDFKKGDLLIVSNLPYVSNGMDIRIFSQNNIEK